MESFLHRGWRLNGLFYGNNKGGNMIRVNYLKMAIWKETFGVETSAPYSAISFKEYQQRFSRAYPRLKKDKVKRAKVEASHIDPEFERAMEMLKDLPDMRG